MIADAILNQIQERTDIVEIISGFVVLKRAGRNFKAPCPFHNEKTPSFVVSPDKQIFHCFGCGAGGNVFGFLMKHEKKEFREVVELLADRVGVEIPKERSQDSEGQKRTELFIKANTLAMDFYHQVLLKNPEAEKARSYLKKRGISGHAIEEFKLGYAPESWDSLSQALKGEAPDAVLEKAGLLVQKKEGGFYDRFRHRIIFPILDLKGFCVAFGARVLDDALPKYLNSPETEIYSKGRNLYGLFQAKKTIREKDWVVVVEGYLDLVACHEAGVQNTVASLGTALTPDQVRLIKRHTKNVLILYDADKAGELATLRGLELFVEEGLEVKIVRLSGGHDPDSFVRENGPDRFKQELLKAKSLFDYRLSLLKDSFDSRSLEGKVKIANEMVTLFSKVQNEILKNAWLKELAHELGLSEEALGSEMRKSENKTRIVKSEESIPVKVEIHSAEKLVVGLLLEDDRFIERAKEEIRLSDFQNTKAREIVKKLFDADTVSTPKQFLNFYKDDPEAVHVVSLASTEAEMIVDKEKTFSDCVFWFKRSRIRLEREHLKSQLELAQQEGDKNRICKLLVDFNELNKGMRKIHEEK